MTYHNRAICLALLFPLLVLTGCFSLGRDEPPQRHYVLGGSPLQETGDAAERVAGLTIGLRQLQLAGYLETPLLVVRRGPHQIRFSEFHRWGEDLGTGVNRAVAGYLAGRPPISSVDVVPWRPGTDHDYLIQLHVSRFEGVAPEVPETSGGEAHLLATWEIIRPQDGAVLARGTTDHQGIGWTEGDYEGLVSLLDLGLQALSDDLIAELEELGTP